MKIRMNKLELLKLLEPGIDEMLSARCANYNITGFNSPATGEYEITLEKPRKDETIGTG